MLKDSNLNLKLKDVFFLIVLVLTAALYFPVLHEHPTLQYDDQSLLTPLQELESVPQYFAKISQHQILDLQPVRDLSYWTELRIEGATGYRNSQAVNLALWLGILFLTWMILQSEFQDSPWNGFLILLLAVHPVATSSVAWIAARKHLLSAFFILIATYFSLQRVRSGSNRYGLRIVLCYALSVLSQPISLLWPSWFAFVAWRSRRKETALTVWLFVIAALVAAANYKYYTSEVFSKISPESPPKLNEESWRNLLNRILVWGRYVFQMLIPIRPVGLPYRLLQWPSYFGLALLTLITGALIVFRRKVDFRWVVLLSLPILMMTVKLTHHAGFDTYILFSLAGLILFLGSILRAKKIPVTAFALLIPLVAGLVTFSYLQIQKWNSEYLIFEQGYHSEGTILATVGFIQLLIDHQEFERASEILKVLQAGDPENREIPRLKGRLFFLENLPAEQKRELFLKNEISHPWYQYYFAVFEVSQGQAAQGNQRLMKSWHQDPEKFKVSFADQASVLFPNWKKICSLAQASDCDEIEHIESEFNK